MTKYFISISAALVLCACAGPQVSRVQELAESADAPYENVLVVSLFKSFDARRYLENDIVKELEKRGIRAVASTSQMDTRTPVTRQTFLAMVDSLSSDAVLVTQLVSLQSDSKMKDMNPQATYNVRQTYSYNVWSIEQTEYVEPQALELTHNLVLSTQVYSARDQKPVWGIESKTKITQNFDQRVGASVIASEAKSIVSYMSRDGLLAP